ncbi:MAG: Hsp20/alpha crystallin family protein [Acidobacteriota bacterium]
MRTSRLLVSTDVGDLSAEVARLFEDLGRRRTHRPVPSGECLPLWDVFETDRAVEIVLDIPGVRAENMRVVIKSGVVLVVGEKDRPERTTGPSSYHLVERDFGRFARALRVHVAIDAAEATARLRQGELRIGLPKIPERRGVEHHIAIDIASSP